MTLNNTEMRRETKYNEKKCIELRLMMKKGIKVHTKRCQGRKILVIKLKILIFDLNNNYQNIELKSEY